MSDTLRDRLASVLGLQDPWLTEADRWNVIRDANHRTDSVCAVLQRWIDENWIGDKHAELVLDELQAAIE